MKKLILFIALLISFAAQSQVKWGVRNSNYYPFNGIKIDSVVVFPDTTFRKAPNGAIAYDTVAKKLFVKDTTWKVLSTPGGSGADSLLSQYSVVGSGKSSNKFRLDNDSNVVSNTTPLAYQILNGRRGYYPIKADTADIFGIDSSVTFNNLTELKTTQLYRKGARIATTAGYTSRNDGGGALYSYNAGSTTTPDDKLIILPGGKTVDSTGRWELIVKGRIRAAEVGIKSNGSNQGTALSSLTSVSSVKEIIIDGGAITINDTVNFHGKKLIVQNGAYITGSGIIDSVVLECDYLQQAFDTTLTVTNLINSIRSVRWFGAVADYKEDGTSVTYTNNLTAFTKCYNAGVDLQLSDTRYLMYKDCYVPAARRKGYGYYLGGQWLWNAEGTVFGDGASSTKLFFPSGLDSAAIYIAPPLTSSSGFGGTVIRKGGQNQVFHDLSFYGSPITPGIGAGGYFDNKSHGVFVASPNVLGYNFDIERFLGDGVHVYADVQQTPATNANNCTFRNFVSNMNGGSGFSARGGDANNNRLYDFNTSKNARWGIADYSFLGNKYDGGHAADNSYENQWQRTNVFNSGHHYFAILPQVKYVWEAGNVYKCILNHDRTAANSDPATGSASSTYWSLIGAGSPNDSIADYADEGNWTFISKAVIPGVTTGWANYWQDWGTWGGTDVFNPQYDSTHFYVEGGGYLAHGQNNRAIFNGCYVEGDQHQFTNRGLGIAIGGFLAVDGNEKSAIGFDNTLNTINALGFSAKNQTNGFKVLISSRYGTNTEYPFIGFKGTYYNLGFEYYNGAWVSSWADEFFGAGLGKVKFISPEYDVHGLMGRDRTPGGVKILTDEIFLNLINSTDSSRSIRLSTTVPTSGDFSKGDIVFCTDANSNIASWICTGASTLGSGATFSPRYKGASSYSVTGTTGRIALFDQSTGALTDDSHLAWTSTKTTLSTDTVAVSNLQINKAFDLPTTSYANSGGSGDRTASITATTDLGISGTWNHMINGVKAPETGLFFTGSSVSGKNMTFDFGSGQSKVVTELTWYQSSGAFSHGTWKAQGSDDGSAWTDVSANQTLGGSASSTFTLSPTKGYRYYRLLGVSGNTSGLPWIEEIEFKINDASAGAAYTKIQADGDIKAQPNGGHIEVPTELTADSSNRAASTAFVHTVVDSVKSTISVGGTTTNALTFNNSGSGDASGSTFNGSAAKTLSYNSIGAMAASKSVTTLSSQYTDASNTSTTETNLLSYTLPANTLLNAGDRIVIEAMFTTPSNGNSKSMTLYFGGFTLVWTSSTIANGATIYVRATIYKTGSNTQRIQIERITGYSDFPSYTTGSENDSGSILIKFTGTGAASNDITQRTMTVTYYPAP